MKEWLTNNRVAVTIACIALLVRVLMIGGVAWWGGGDALQATFAPGSDSSRYANLGHNLAVHHIYSPSKSSPFMPEETIEPIYPFFLALLFGITESIVLVALVQALIAAATAFLVFRLACLFMGTRPSGIAALLFAVEPVAVYLSGALFTETVFLFLFLLGAYLFLSAAYDPGRRGRMLTGGAVLGLSALTRPEVQFLPVVFAALFLLAVWYRGGSLRRAGATAVLFLVGFALAVSPWLARNRLTYGSWQTSSIGIHKVYLFDLLYFYSHQEGVSFKEAREVFRERVAAISPYGNDDPTFANAPYLQQVAIDYIKEQPVAFAVFYTVKTLPFFFSDGLRYVVNKFDLLDAPTINISGYVFEGEFGKLFHALSAKDTLPFLLLIVGGAFWLIINLGALLGVWYAFRLRRTRAQILLPAALFASLVLIFALMSGPVSNPRLRFKAEPFMFILAVFGFSKLAHARLNRARALPNVLHDNE